MIVGVNDIYETKYCSFNNTTSQGNTWLTIFTPTYNRVSRLPELYASLLNQDFKGFEWLIVDDGSTDSTRDLVLNWAGTTSEFPIRYIYQENAGKAMAHNRGVLEANGNLFFCVDSDDFLPPNAVRDIYSAWEMIKNDSSISGCLALKSDRGGDSLGKIWPEYLTVCSLRDFEYKYRFGGERAMIIKTAILRNYLFPEIMNNKFFPESVIYYQIDSKYDVYLLRRVVTICEYLEDGYTRNIRKIMAQNPTGFKVVSSEKIDYVYALSDRIRAAISYNIFSHLSNDTAYDYFGKHQFLVKICYPIGIIGAFVFRFLYQLKDE